MAAAPWMVCIAIGRKREEPRAKSFFLMRCCLYTWKENPYPEISALIFWAIIVACPA